jgi:2-polyprenyl-3-methyl-5-hydroxy-6-metoxy-1,4-benzoquinol methylase
MIRRLFFELQYLLKRARWDTGISPPELLAFLDNHPPGRALDLGCGTGTNAITLAQHRWDVIGIDISTRAIREAHLKAEKAGVNVHFLQGDVADLKGVEGTFDLILDIGCFHAISIASKKKYADNLLKHLSPNGFFLLYTWLEQEIDGDESLSTEEKILDLFSGCCECISVVHGSDWASQRLSAWFTMRRVT